MMCHRLMQFHSSTDLNYGIKLGSADGTMALYFTLGDIPHTSSMKNEIYKKN